LQPELLKGGDYTLTINIRPALHFPVSASGHPKIEGFWGDGRDDNSRKHEGIDIFAPKGTPALAADNGTVVNVSENKLGGLVVLMQPDGRDYTLYYAHLGVQLVHNGQQVKAGDTVGLIDNTGNAKNTPSHLHFGIYTSAGAVDPLLFVRQQNENPLPVIASINKLGTMVSYDNIPVTVSAATNNSYKVIYPDNSSAFINAAQIKPLGHLLHLIKSRQAFYDKPDSSAAQIIGLSPDDQVNVAGIYQGYQFVTFKDKTGWIKIVQSNSLKAK